ncbi:MAG: hypothetical protein H6726_13680 [Sandaracinaceae bacterium]|nr:hypothetical protein [Sandaracinaceae bacterium]
MPALARFALVLCAATCSLVSVVSWGVAQPTPAPTRSPAASPAPEPQALMEGVPTKMGRRIVSQLRTTHRAMPTVLRAAHLTQPDGGERVFLVYEYSPFDACVSAAPSRAEGRRTCREQVDARCTTTKAAFVTVAPTPAGRTAGTGGAITVVFDDHVGRGCLTHRVLDVAIRDVDGDRQPELVVDIVRSQEELGFRNRTEFERRMRDVVIYDTTGREQLRTALGAWGPTEEETATGSVAARWSMRDTNGDRRPDVVVETFAYEEMYTCPFTDDGWFTPRSADDVEGYECSGEVQLTTFRYDAARDAFGD